MTQPDEEFMYSLVILGGIIFAGLMLTICLTAMGIAIYRKKKETKIIIHGKEKENGQAKKGGSRGKW